MSTDPRNLFEGIQVVGFDLDQTLYPKSPVIDEKIQSYLYARISEHRGVTLVEAEKLFKDRYRQGAGMSGSETLADLGLPNGSELVQEALEHADLASVLTPDSATIQFIQTLRKRFVGVDLVTGSNLVQTTKKLAALDLPLDLFTQVITKDDASKSNGDAYRMWLSHYPAWKSEQFLYIGDRIRTDHEIPAALGIRTCLVYVTKAKATSVTTELPDFADLRELLPE